MSTKFVESPPEYEYHLTEFDVSNIKFEKKIATAGFEPTTFSLPVVSQQSWKGIIKIVTPN